MKAALKQHHSRKDLGPEQQFLGLAFSQHDDRRTITLSQELYINKILKPFQKVEAYGVQTPMNPNVCLDCDTRQGEAVVDPSYYQSISIGRNEATSIRRNSQRYVMAEARPPESSTGRSRVDSRCASWRQKFPRSLTACTTSTVISQPALPSAERTVNTIGQQETGTSRTGSTLVSTASIVIPSFATSRPG
jgi:hypothetical protein